MGDRSSSRAPSRSVTFHGLRSYLIQQNVRGTSCNFSKRLLPYTEFPLFPQPVSSPRVIHEIPKNPIRRTTMGGVAGTMSVRIPGLCSPKIENPPTFHTTVHRVFKFSEGFGSIKAELKPTTPDLELRCDGIPKDCENSSSDKSVSPIATQENCVSPDDAQSSNESETDPIGHEEHGNERQMDVKDKDVDSDDEVNIIPETEQVEQESDADSNSTVLVPVEVKEKLRAQLEARKAKESASSSSPSIGNSSPSCYSTSEPSPVSADSEPVSVRTRSHRKSSVEHGVEQNRRPGRNKNDATAPNYYKDHHWKKLLLQSYLRAKLITDGEERAALALATRQAASRNPPKKTSTVSMAHPNKNPNSKTSSREEKVSKEKPGSVKAEEKSGERSCVAAKVKAVQDESLPPRKRQAFRRRNT